ncbi:MAG: alpha-mannosidase [Vulcanimicrobiaceae bacterium]
MRLSLSEVERTQALAILAATLPPSTEATRIAYSTRTGALLRVDGAAAGAFDREHHEAVLPPSSSPRELRFEVELRALPTNGLPSGPGLTWMLLNARAHQTPQLHAEVISGGVVLPEASGGEVRAIGHSHLDVAWLWTYAETRRKAARTFAIARDLLDRDATFAFAQSQPQLYAFVEQDDPHLFARVAESIAAGRWDPQIAAMWVEPDCNLPSGESLLRQMLFAHRYCVERFGIEPSIAWLPDSFGFANTLPQLLSHAGIHFFATTKLQWNDTTRFPYPQFVWQGPDGSEVVGALIQSYDGGLSAERIRIARERNEPVVAGYGDGGGGVTNEMLADVRRDGGWIRPGAWFASLEARRTELPVHRDELYLEFHRGVYTTHHDLKHGNALLERALLEAEELAAWCTAVRAPRELLANLRERLRAAWEIVLRNQFHDVLPGTSIEPVHVDALDEYAGAGELVAGVMSAAAQALPRARAQTARIERSEPVGDDDGVLFDNGLLRARVQWSGAIVELAAAGGPNVCTQGNVLALYTDKPKKWEAWNIDAGYERTMRHARPQGGTIEDGSLVIPFALGKSAAVMRISLFAGEPFLRVDLDVDWRERRTLLRVEQWLPLETDRVTYGTPHGTIVRSARRRTPQERAKFEVPGQRFAMARDNRGAGLAMFSLDTYGWSARTLESGGLQVGHSLLRGTTWPDEHADLGEKRFSYAYAPFAGVNTGAIERAWLAFAHDPHVRLFTCEDDAVAIVACKPAEDGDGVIVRVRECDGTARHVWLRCGARMREFEAVDALERRVHGDARIEEERLLFDIGAFALRAFRVRF